MQLKKSIVGAAVALALMTAGSSARADSLVIGLAGWKSYGAFGAAFNTASFYSLTAGSQITGYSYTGLTLTTSNGSFLNEFVISVNNFDGSAFMDWAPSTSAASGSFGPASGAWGGPNGSGAGGAFSLTAGANNLWVTVYETFDDPFGDTGLLLDATVSAGTLTITYTSPIPEPAGYGLMGAGLLALRAAARRRQSGARAPAHRR